MLTVIAVTNPKYSNIEHTTIDCWVQFAEFNEILPFHATPYDPEPHGQSIYSNLISGAYGDIAPYVPPIQVEKFEMTHIRVDSWNLNRVFANSPGSVYLGKESPELTNNNPVLVTIVTSGRRVVQAPNGSEPEIEFGVGGYNLDFPNLNPTLQYKTIALEANTEYYRLSRQDLQPFEIERFSLNANQILNLSKLKRAFFGGGRTSTGTGVHLVRADLNDRQIEILEPTFGVLF